MSGDADYHLRVLVRSLNDFEYFLRHKLTRISGVSQVTTSFGLRQVVYRTALPSHIASQDRAAANVSPSFATRETRKSNI